MGLFDRLFGRHRASSTRSWPTRVDPWEHAPQGTSVTGVAPAAGPVPGRAPPAGRDADAQALDRYQYLVRTAPPQVLEQVHREAFSRLSPEQRRRALYELNASMPPGERLTRDDPAALARLATRAELMRPGTVVSAFGGGGFGGGIGMGMGGLLAGSLLTSFVGSAMGSMLAHQWMDGGFHGGHGFDHGFQDGYGDGYGDGFEAGQDSQGDVGESADAGDLTTADWDGGGGGDDFGGGWGDGGGFDDSII